MDDSTVELRKCKKCGIEKPLDEFPPDRLNPVEPYKSQGRTYRQHGCKDCQKSDKVKYHSDNHETINAKKKATYDADPEAARERARNYGRTDKSKKTRRAYYEKNGDRLREIGKISSRKWRVDHPKESRLHSKLGKAKRKKAKVEVITKEQIANLHAQQRGRCPICLKKFGDNYHIDHIVPLAKGGAHEIKNLQLLCPFCNISKNDHDPIHYMQKRGFLL